MPAASWTLPPELGATPPRRCVNPLTTRAANALLALALATFVWLPLYGYLAARDLSTLQTSGEAVRGTVTDLATETHAPGSSRVSSGSSSTGYSVEYQYSAAETPGVIYRRRVNVSASDFAPLNVGGPVQVLYDRAAPDHSALAFETAPFPGHEKVMALELFFFAMAVITGLGLWRRVSLQRAQKRLLMWGQAAPITVTAKKVRQIGKSAATTMEYTFIDARGETVAAVAEFSSLARSVPAEACATVLFDPKNSAVHALYPFSPVVLAATV
ncbi:MAG: hypothetical protein JWN73_4325 [Betaproteobacteria bacterium]|nr:hypothetical protein [Betaproteobacteria bacterium]